MVSHKKTIFHGKRSIVGSINNLILELSKGVRCEDCGSMGFHWRPCLQAKVLEILLHCLLLSSLIFEIYSNSYLFTHSYFSNKERFPTKQSKDNRPTIKQNDTNWIPSTNPELHEGRRLLPFQTPKKGRKKKKPSFKHKLDNRQHACFCNSNLPVFSIHFSTFWGLVWISTNRKELKSDRKIEGRNMLRRKEHDVLFCWLSKEKGNERKINY